MQGTGTLPAAYWLLGTCLGQRMEASSWPTGPYNSSLAGNLHPTCAACASRPGLCGRHFPAQATCMAAGVLHCALRVSTAHGAVLCCTKDITEEATDSLP